jgi:hypothetical protein
MGRIEIDKPLVFASWPRICGLVAVDGRTIIGSMMDPPATSYIYLTGSFNKIEYHRWGPYQVSASRHQAEPHQTPFLHRYLIVKMLLFSPIIKKYLSISMHGLMCEPLVRRQGVGGCSNAVRDSNFSRGHIPR